MGRPSAVGSSAFSGRFTFELPTPIQAIARIAEDLSQRIARREPLLGKPWQGPEHHPNSEIVPLVDAHEAQHFPIAPADPVAAILFRMEQEELEREDLEVYRWPPPRAGGFEPSAGNIVR